MPTLNPKISKEHMIADRISKALIKKGHKVNKKRIRTLIEKLFEPR